MSLKRLVACIALGLASPAIAQDLVVRVDGLRASKGNVTVCLWREAGEFPNCETGAPAARQSIAADARSVTVTFQTVAPGPLAISAFHDENGNGRFDSNMIGLPLEGVALSNNPKPRFGPPKFKASVMTPKPATPVVLRMNYL